MKDANFALELINIGYKPDEVKTLMKHFWADGRIDPRSSAFQAALLAIPSVKNALLVKAAQLEEKKEKTEQEDI